MDIEQLKLIIEMVNTLGGSAKEVFVWWLVMSKGPIIVFGIIWTIVGFCAIRWGYFLIHSLLAGERLRKAAEVRISWSESELTRAETILRKHYQDIAG